MLYAQALVLMEIAHSQILVRAMLDFMGRHATENVLLISGVLIACMTALAGMEPSVIPAQGAVPAPLGGKASCVKNHVTRVSLVTDVNRSAFA